MNMTQAELIRAYWPVLTVEERVQFLTNAAAETEHITLEGAEDETRYAYSRTGDAALEVFTGV